MVIAIPLAAQSDYTELKYCLRSIEKHLPKMEVVIIGSIIPHWLHNVTQIHLPDIPGKKQFSIRKKIFAALQYSGQIFFTNDDIFFIKDCDPGAFPYYSKGSLAKEPETGAKPLREKLSELNKPHHHFDCHYPIVYERKKFCELEQFPAECIIKSMYGNYHGLQPTEIQDCKVLKKASPELLRSMLNFLPCISTDARGLPYVLPILQELFKEKSIFEL